MCNRDPFEICSEIVRHLPNHIARQSMKLDPVAEFRRQNDFPQPLIAGRLPSFQFADDVDTIPFPVEPDRSRFVLNGALACKIAPVGSPLPARSAAEVRHPNRTTLAVRAAGTNGGVCAASKASPFSAAARVVHEQPVRTRPRRTLTPRRGGPAGANPDWPVVIAQDHG